MPSTFQISLLDMIQFMFPEFEDQQSQKKKKTEFEQIN